MGKYRKLLFEGGLPEFNKEFEARGKSNFFDGFLYRIAEKLGITEFLKKIEEMDKMIPESGIGKANKEFLEELGIEITGETPEWTEQTGKAVLFYSNHDSRIEPFVISALLKREDVAFVGGHFSQHLGENVRQHILPILPTKYASDRKSKLNLREKILYGDRPMTEQEIIELNKQSIKSAAERLTNGEAIGIFPSGAEKMKDKWYPGIGRIIEQIPPEARNNILLAPIHVSDYSYGDLRKAVRKRFAKNLPPDKKQVEVQFGPAENLSDLIPPDAKPDEIINILQEKYLEQFESEK